MTTNREIKMQAGSRFAVVTLAVTEEACSVTLVRFSDERRGTEEYHSEYPRKEYGKALARYIEWATDTADFFAVLSNR